MRLTLISGIEKNCPYCAGDIIERRHISILEDAWEDLDRERTDRQVNLHEKPTDISAVLNVECRYYSPMIRRIKKYWRNSGLRNVIIASKAKPLPDS